MEGWLEQNNLARFVVEIVEQLNTSAIERAYRGGAVRRKLWVLTPSTPIRIQAALSILSAIMRVRGLPSRLGDR